jgi:hypothetical protein
VVQAIINIDEETNRVLNVVKAKYSLKDKSQAIDYMAQQYKEEILEPQVRPEYLRKLRKIEAETPIPFNSMEELDKIIKNAFVRNRAKPGQKTKQTLKKR